MRTTITAQASSVWGFIPASPEEEDIVRDETHQAVEPEGKSVWYEGLLLAISFVFLLLGVLPPRKNGPRELICSISSR